MPISDRTRRFPHLSAAHLAKLAKSNLRLDTIERAELYTERDTGRLRQLLRNEYVVAPALVLPGIDRHGNRNGWDVARFNPPHRFPDGTEAKYLQPSVAGSRVYFPRFPTVQQAVNAPGRLVLITEGILKALAAAQAGVPCLGLMGTWNWVVGESSPRQLIPDLAEMDWQGRPVLLVFDTDSTRKPNVNHAAAELARVLKEKGADVRIPRLPFGPPGPLGLPEKTGQDEFIAHLARRTKSSSAGDAAFREWVQQQSQEPTERNLDEWREEMLARRIESLGALRKGMDEVLLDASPTGSGKSFLDLQALRHQEEAAAHARSRNYRNIWERAMCAMSNPLPSSLTSFRHTPIVPRLKPRRERQVWMPSPFHATTATPVPTSTRQAP